GTVCVVGKMRDLILQLSKSSIYSTKPPDDIKIIVILSDFAFITMTENNIVLHITLIGKGNDLKSTNIMRKKTKLKTRRSGLILTYPSIISELPKTEISFALF
ncbi:hypothetical protein SJ620_26005, partial [Citrobacter freundii]|nr:hypothetical protein [Citrobacter freundii]